MMPYILVGVLSFLVALALGLFLGYRYRKNAAEKEIGSAEQEATRIVNDALKSAESKKREAWWKLGKKFIKSAAFTNRK